MQRVFHHFLQFAVDNFAAQAIMKSRYNLYGRGRPLQWAITFACQLAFVLFGYDQGVFSGIVGNEHFRSTFGNPSDSLTGIIVSIYNLGCFSGCVLNFFIGDWLGRRKAMWFAMCWIIVGATLQASAFSVPHMLVARYLTGMCWLQLWLSWS